MFFAKNRRVRRKKNWKICVFAMSINRFEIFEFRFYDPAVFENTFDFGPNYSGAWVLCTLDSAVQSSGWALIDWPC